MNSDETLPVRIVSKVLSVLNVGKQDDFHNILTDDAARKRVVFLIYDVLICLIAFFMTIVNWITGEYETLIATAAIVLICILDYILFRFNISFKIISYIFEGLLFLVTVAFVVTGHPEGFSALWICLAPMLTMMFTGRKAGSVYGLVGLVTLIFLFWTPFGRSLLQFQYTDTFLLRFPFFYSAVFILSFFMEFVRSRTQASLVSEKEKYSQLFRHDALTGLYNRYGVKEQLDKINGLDKGNAVVMIADIDHFKAINDTYGHDAGDKILMKVAEVFRNTVCSDCTIARWGGEEFLLVMFCKHDPVKTAETLRSNIENTVVKYGDCEIRMTISIGVCIADDCSGYTSENVINMADQSLYDAKESGRNKVCICHAKEKS